MAVCEPNFDDTMFHLGLNDNRFALFQDVLHSNTISTLPNIMDKAHEELTDSKIEKPRMSVLSFPSLTSMYSMVRSHTHVHASENTENQPIDSQTTDHMTHDPETVEQPIKSESGFRGRVLKLFGQTDVLSNRDMNILTPISL